MGVQTRVIELAGDINFAMATTWFDACGSSCRSTAPCPVPRCRVQGRRERRAQLPSRTRHGAPEEAGAPRRFRRPLVATPAAPRQSGRKAVDPASVTPAPNDLVVALVRNPAWPRDSLLASGVPIFDACERARRDTCPRTSACDRGDHRHAHCACSCSSKVSVRVGPSASSWSRSVRATPPARVTKPPTALVEAAPRA